MGPRGLLASLSVVFVSFFAYSTIFTELEDSEDAYQKTDMNIAKKIATNVIKAAPNGPVKAS